MDIEGYIELTARIVRAEGDGGGYVGSCVELSYSAEGSTVGETLANLKRELTASLSYLHREEELVDLLNWRGLPVTLAEPVGEREVMVAPGMVVCLLVGTLIRNRVMFEG